MTDWELVLEVFFSGILGVFIVMIFLQLSTQASSAVIGYLEKRGEAADAEKVIKESSKEKS